MQSVHVKCHENIAGYQIDRLYTDFLYLYFLFSFIAMRSPYGISLQSNAASLFIV